MTRARAAPAGVVAAGKTMYDKIVQDHIVDKQEDGTLLLYIDRHMVHEVTSPQAFEVRHLSLCRSLEKCPAAGSLLRAVATRDDPNLPLSCPRLLQGLRTAGREVRRPDCTLVTVDHNVPTLGPLLLRHRGELHQGDRLPHAGDGP